MGQKLNYLTASWCYWGKEWARQFSTLSVVLRNDRPENKSFVLLRPDLLFSEGRSVTLITPAFPGGSPPRTPRRAAPQKSLSTSEGALPEITERRFL